MQTKTGLMVPRHAIENGAMTDWTHVERIFQQICYHQHILPEDSFVCSTETIFASVSRERERFLQCMFETFNIRGLFLSAQEAMALCSTGKTSGLVINCGHGPISLVPVLDGHPNSVSSQRLSLEGNTIDQALKKMLLSKGSTMPTQEQADAEAVTAMKHKFGMISMDPSKEKGLPQSFYTLPDGKTVITLESERYLCTEPLFAPSLIGNPSPSIHQATANVLQRCSDFKSELRDGIFLTGGSIQLSGFTQRFTSETKRLVPNAVIEASSDPEHSAWLGAQGTPSIVF
jgi:actin-related protein